MLDHSEHRRWCRRCERPTEHDALHSEGGAISRLAWGALTAGMSELMGERYWVCQRCGLKTERQS